MHDDDRQKQYTHRWPDWWDGKNCPDVPFPKINVLLGEQHTAEEVVERVLEMEEARKNGEK